ncbi:hypothetical protein HOLleu_27324 [Holothuria leucospilota]|uniref:CCHC-type domain-containing protein n=1 Tax=Holothuria leucospilota TaxID=206669 RepID=A0A9Q1BQH0_HOLLE|nr:hypothetical protein HOLleu_27324 [Holothuria leucospilota]
MTWMPTSSALSANADSMGWGESEWMTPLSALLTGKALEVYARLPQSQAREYKTLRTALLRRYDLHEEGFRLKFRRAKIEEGETYTQFADRLKSYLERWVELGAKKDYSSLVDLLLREQIQNVCPRDLGLFLKEHKPKDVLELAKFADRYQDAHGRSSQKERNGKDRKFKDNASREGVGPTNEKSLSSVKCFNCQGRGHIAKDCPSPKAKQSGKKASAGLRIKSKDSRSEQSQKPPDAGVNESNSSDTGVGAMCMLKDSTRSGLKDDHIVHLRAADSAKTKLPVVCAVSISTDMPVVQGKIGQANVTVLRDTGCNTVVVRDKFVSLDQYTGDKVSCALLDGTERDVPVARVMVDTPYFVGEVEALVMVTPLQDLIIGNVSGAREPSNPNPDWKPGTEHTADSADRNKIGGVETRSQKAKGSKPFQSLLTGVRSASNISKEDIVAAQHADTELKRLWELSSKQTEPKVGKNGSKVTFVVKVDLKSKYKDI